MGCYGVLQQYKVLTDYKPVLPSKIIQTLNKVSSERQIPSKVEYSGTNVFALKRIWFWNKNIYSRQQYNKWIWRNLLSCYIESGIPIIIAMENSTHGSIGHTTCSWTWKLMMLQIGWITPYVISTTFKGTCYQEKHIYDTFNKKGFHFLLMTISQGTNYNY